jgi:hypothetical protein
MRALPTLWISAAVGALVWEYANPVLAIIAFAAIWGIAFLIAVNTDRY